MSDFQNKRSIEILGGQCLNAAVQIYATRTRDRTVDGLSDDDYSKIFVVAIEMLRCGKDVGFLEAINSIANE